MKHEREQVAQIEVILRKKPDELHRFHRLHARPNENPQSKFSVNYSYNKDLGQTITLNNEKYLITTSNDLTDLLNIKSSGGLQPAFRKFTEALEKAHSQGRLREIGKLTSANGKWIHENINGLPFIIDILGPVTSQLNGSVYFKWFEDSSHTRNGHSLVLKLIYGEISLLFGGDLNELSETYLLKHYGNQNPFLVDVAKVAIMALANLPLISSGRSARMRPSFRPEIMKIIHTPGRMP